MNIKELREKAGLSQSEFADYLHVSIRTIQDWEQCKRTPLEYVAELIEYKLKQEGLIEKKDTKTVYVVTSEYEGEDCTSNPIEAVFSDYVKAARYCACQKREDLYIEEWAIDSEEVISNEDVVTQWTFHATDEGLFNFCENKQFVLKYLSKNHITSEVLSRYNGEMNFYTIELALSIGVTEDEAREIAADRLAIYKAEKEI